MAKTSDHASGITESDGLHMHNLDYQHLLAVMNAAVFAINKQGVITSVSGNVQTLTGQTAAELAHQSLKTLFPQSTHHALFASIEACDGEGRNMLLTTGDTVIVRVIRMETDPDHCHVILQATRQTQPSPQETEQKHREQLYRVLARNLPDTAVMIFDRDLNLIIAEGDILELMFDFEHDVTGNNLTRIVVGDAHALIEQHRATIQGEALRGEYHVRNHIFDIQTLPIEDNTSQITGGMTVVRNISGQRQFEQALADNERRLRALLDALPDILFVIDDQGYYTEAHAPAGVELMVAKDNLIGSNIRETLLPPEVIDEALMMIDIALETEQVQAFEYVLQKSDAYRYYEARLMKLNEREVLMLVRDMTTLKRVQEELGNHIEDLTILRQIDSELSDNLNMNYVKQLALDATMRLSKANTGFIALLQTGKLNVVHHIGGYDLHQVQRESRQRKSPLALALQDQQGVLITRDNGTSDDQFLISGAVARMIVPLSSQDRVIGVLNLETRSNDGFSNETFQFVKLITGRIAVMLENARLYEQTQVQLDELQRLLEEVSRLGQLKTDMIRIASHDLKNPLAASMGYLEMLRWDTANILDEQQRGYLDNIGKASERMQKITTSILSLERIEQMAQNSTAQLFDLGELVAKVVADRERDARAKAIKLKSTKPAGRTMVLGDPVQLQEAIDNLISNAIKYTPEQGTVRIVVKSSANGTSVQVIDNGYGIPKMQQERLFTAFYRVETRETEDIEGTGLGLHLVKNIIERHKGDVIFKSEHGTGSTFGFELPPLRDQLSEADSRQPVDGSSIVG